MSGEKKTETADGRLARLLAANPEEKVTITLGQLQEMLVAMRAETRAEERAYCLALLRGFQGDSDFAAAAPVNGWVN